MQKIKDIVQKIKTFIIAKRKYWYWGVLLLVLIGFANTELLSMIIPCWGTYLINAVLIIFLTVYAQILIDNLKERIKDKVTEDESKLYRFLENSFKETNEAVCKVDENITNCTESVQKELGLSKQAVLADLEAKQKVISEEIASVQKYEEEMHDSFKNKIEQFESDNKKQLESSASKILSSVEASENNLNKKLSEQTELINENVTNLNKSIEEVRSVLTESVKKLLKTADASLQEVQKETIENIANQTKELVAKLDDILAENKNAFAGNLEELQKTRDIIVKKLVVVNETNQVKAKEYHDSVEEKLISADDRVMKEFASIKEMAKEIEEKRVESDSSAFESIHAKANEIIISGNELANKLNMMTENIEQYEQRTASVIAESSATVSKEVKEGVIQLTSHMNDASEKMIEQIQKNDIETTETLDNHRQDILSAISGREVKAQENYNSMVTLLDDIKKSMIEVGKELSNVEQGNIDLTEGLKKSITTELHMVGDELSKIEDSQKANVLQIIELVDTKLLTLNQELVKQANSILDKSDENSDYISEKYNRVFDQIQSVAKESKLLINRVNDAIEENKNAIIQSQKDATNSIDVHFQDMKNKGKELESLKTVVERNFSNINSELEITRGQLASLNLLSVLIKNLSEKKDEKVEKKQNRVETIEDSESGLTVKNEYKQDKLVMSEMFRGSKKVYDVLYGNMGEIISTKNYDESGKVSLEMIYHSNGQVKERREYISGKAEISKFDANGNKIK